MYIYIDICTYIKVYMYMCANTPTPTRPRKATRTSTQFDQLFKLSTKKDNAARDDKVHFCFRGWKLN